MSQASKENAKGRRLWTALLALAMLTPTSGLAMAQEEPSLTYAETLVEPMKYYSDGLVVSQGLSDLLSAEKAEVHTVTYYLQEPVSGVWMHYHTEERPHGRLAKGPLYSPIDPVGNYERVFIGWYEDENFTAGPVNLLRMPITADLSLYARFGDEADVFVPEDFEVVITFMPSLSFADVEAETAPEGEEPVAGSVLDTTPEAAAEPDPDTDPAPEPIPVEIIAAIQGEAEAEALPEGLVCTIAAQVEGIPEDVYYTLQWQNDLSGELTDIPGETVSSITFPASRESLSCVWRLAIIF